jgi:hypothetical protein
MGANTYRLMSGFAAGEVPNGQEEFRPEDNGDGTMSGYTYNATMNWSSGSHTYGLGAP